MARASTYTRERIYATYAFLLCCVAVRFLFCTTTHTSDDIHSAGVRVYVHALRRVDIIAEEVMLKMKQMCWCGHKYGMLHVWITYLEL